MPNEQRDLARDIRDGKEGEVMDENQAGTVLYLRPVGGGVEWEVPRKFIEIIKRATEHAA